MEKITGRSDDMMIVRGVNVFPTQIEEHILAVEGLSPHYQIELGKQGHLDSIKVHCELQSDDLDADSVAERLKQRIKNMVGISAQIHVHKQGGVMRSQGKAQRVIDTRVT